MDNNKLPKRIDCRVDYKTINGNTYSFLIEYGSKDFVIYYEYGVKKLNELYSSLKFRINGYMTIDNYPFTFMPYDFKKLSNAKYDF